jgi:hypothetical protein
MDEVVKGIFTAPLATVFVIAGVIFFACCCGRQY